MSNEEQPYLDDEKIDRRIKAMARQNGGCLTLILGLAVCLGGGYIAWEQKDWTMLAFFETAGASVLVWSVEQMRE